MRANRSNQRDAAAGDEPGLRRRVAVAIVAVIVVASACGGQTTGPPSPPVRATSTPSLAPAPMQTRAPEPTNASVARVPTAVIEGTDYRPRIDPIEFTTTIDNTFMPFVPGTTLEYEGDGERIVVTVTHVTRDVAGVTAVVVRDRAFEDGTLVEDTADWFAQDRAGNVWYFGEDTAECEDGQPVDTHGAWEAGVAGAQPGIAMLAEPRIGDHYWQEHAAGEAEDQGRVVRMEDGVTVPAGTYQDVLVTEDFTPLEPDVLEEKVYARGVGVIEERTIRGGSGVIRLTAVRHDESGLDRSSTEIDLCRE